MIKLIRKDQKWSEQQVWIMTQPKIDSFFKVKEKWFRLQKER